MEFVLLTEVVISINEKRALRLSSEMERHLQECDRCRKCLPEWVEKIVAWKEHPKNSGQ